MQTGIIHQEVMLQPDTRFSGRQRYKRAGSGSSRCLSERAQLEELCRNGPFYSMLPELIEISPFGKRLNLWQIRQHLFCIRLELCGWPRFIEEKHSIDPGLFLPAMIYN